MVPSWARIRECLAPSYAGCTCAVAWQRESETARGTRTTHARGTEQYHSRAGMARLPNRHCRDGVAGFGRGLPRINAKPKRGFLNGLRSRVGQDSGSRWAARASFPSNSAKLDLHTLIRLFSTLMAWALQGVRLPRGGLHYLQNALVADLARPLSKMPSPNFLPSTVRQFPGQSNRAFSSSSWSRFQQFHRPNLNPKNLLLLPTPALASYTTAASSIIEIDPSKSEVIPTISPCMLTVGAAWAPKRPRSNLPAWCQADCGEDAFFTILVNSNYCLGTSQHLLFEDPF